MENLILDIYPDTWINRYGGNVKVRQYDMKYGVIIARNIISLVFKLPSGMYWASRGKQEYMPARYTVYRLLGEGIKDNSKCIECLLVEYTIDFTIPRKSSKDRVPKNQLSWEELST